MKLNWLNLLTTLPLALSQIAEEVAGTFGAQQEDDNNLQNVNIHFPFKEQLDITPLPRNNLLLTFDFYSISEEFSSGNIEDHTHYKAFPRSIANILKSTGTKDLHLRFGQGWWDSEEWGQLPDGGFKSGGVGVEVWAVIEAKNKEESFDKWINLVNSLSGLFCASLNFIDSSKTTYPNQAFKPERNITVFDESNNLFLLRAALPAEPVCTENLTPFLKFLPTRGKAGISSLLDGHRLFESQWHKMSIDFENVCSENTCHYTMDQRIDMVVDINRTKRRLINQIPKPTHGNDLRCDPSKTHDDFQCFPLGESAEINILLSQIFGRKIKGGNLISENPSSVCVHATESWNIYLKTGENHFGTDTNCFDLNEEEYDVFFQTTNSTDIVPIKQAPIFVSRSFTGNGQDKGGSRTVFRNPLDEPIKLIYFESLPWFMRIYLHTVEIEGAKSLDVLKSIYYLPEIDRKRPTQLEFKIELPPNSNIVLSYSFEKSLLLYAEYPPDANHGFSVEPGVVFVNEPLSYSLRTSSALLTLPTPDFSMPYNVIILSSTVMALAFGTMFNLLVKRVVTEEEQEIVNKSVGIKARILRALKIEDKKEANDASFASKLLHKIQAFRNFKQMVLNKFKSLFFRDDEELNTEEKKKK